ncbi:hypothetical protein Tco_1143180 [Tanacetum coccineum]
MKHHLGLLTRRYLVRSRTGVIVYRYDGLPIDPYVEATIQEPPPPDYVLEPVCPEFIPPEDDVLPAEEKPLPAAVLPTADSPGYIAESDPKEDSEEDDEDPKEDPVDYPTDRDGDEKEEEESSGDDADDEDEDEGEDEEEEHLASADSIPPPQTGTRGARITVQLQPPTASSTEALIAAAAATLSLPLHPSSPLTSYSLPLPQIPSPPLPLPPPIILPRTRESMAMMRAAAPFTYILAPRSSTLSSGIPPSGTPHILPIPLPTSLPPMLLPSTDRRADIPEVEFPPRKRLYIAPGPKYEIEESSSALTARPTGGFKADYRFVSTLDAEIRREAWRQSMDASDMARYEVIALENTVLAQQAKIRELRATDRIRQTQLTKVLTLIRTLQTQRVAQQSQHTPARDPTHPDVPKEAGSSF